MAFGKYEAVLVFDPELRDEQLDDELKKIEQTLAEHNGAIVSKEMWGRRTLAYRIKRRESGIVGTLVFTGEGPVVAALTRQLKINDSVLRSMIVKKDILAPDFVKHARPAQDDALGIS